MSYSHKGITGFSMTLSLMPSFMSNTKTYSPGLSESMRFLFLHFSYSSFISALTLLVGRILTSKFMKPEELEPGEFLFSAELQVEPVCVLVAVAVAVLLLLVVFILFCC